MNQRIIIAALATLLGGCSTVGLDLPRSIGENNSDYSYIPLDPLPVNRSRVLQCDGYGKATSDILSELPDNAVRVAIDDLSLNSNTTLGPVSIGAGGGNYRVVLDYISADTVNVRMRITNQSGDIRGLFAAGNDANGLGGSFLVHRIGNNESMAPLTANDVDVVIPVYVGVGLRLTALVETRRGGINLSSLGAIAAAVDADRASGSLTVQTIGINGSQVAAALPLPSELNTESVQNAILSLGSIKGMIYNRTATNITPRVVGIYNPLPTNDRRLINAIVSELASEPIDWRICQPPADVRGAKDGPDTSRGNLSNQ